MKKTLKTLACLSLFALPLFVGAACHSTGNSSAAPAIDAGKEKGCCGDDKAGCCQDAKDKDGARPDCCAPAAGKPVKN